MKKISSKPEKVCEKVCNLTMWYMVIAPMCVTMLSGLTLTGTAGILYAGVSYMGVRNMCLKLSIVTIANSALMIRYVIPYICVKIYSIPYETWRSF